MIGQFMGKINWNRVAEPNQKRLEALQGQELVESLLGRKGGSKARKLSDWLQLKHLSYLETPS